MRNDDGIAIIPVKCKEKIVYSLVNDDIWHELMTFKWYMTQNYPQTNINGKPKRIHHYILGVDKKSLNGKVVDHLSRNTLDNRREKLKIVTLRQNNQNKNTNRTHIGIYQRSDENRNDWVAKILINDKVSSVGLFNSIITAAIAYNISVIINDYSRINPVTEAQYIENKQEVFGNLVSRRNLISEIEFNRIYDQLISDHSVEA